MLKRYSIIALFALFGVFSLIAKTQAADINAVPASQFYGRFVVTVAQVDPPAWYINPVDKRRYYFDNEFIGYEKAKAMVLGIKNRDLFKIPLPGEKIVGDMALRKRLAGRFLLQVENLGRMWYVHPVDLKRYYMDGPHSIRYLIDHTGIDAEDKTLVRFNIGTNVNIAVLGEKIYNTTTYNNTTYTNTNVISGCTLNPNVCSVSESCVQNICILKSLLTVNTVTANNNQNFGCAYGTVDCGSNFACINNTCVMKTGCAYNNPSCGSGFNCENNVCVRNQYQGCAFGTVTCDINSECISNVCTLRSGCAFNNPGCGNGYSCQNNTCVANTPNLGCANGGPSCSAGFTCSNNTCVATQNCSTNNYVCGSGYACQNNICVPTNRIPCIYGHPTYGEPSFCYADREQCINIVCVPR